MLSANKSPANPVTSSAARVPFSRGLLSLFTADAYSGMDAIYPTGQGYFPLWWWIDCNCSCTMGWQKSMNTYPKCTLKCKYTPFY